MATMRIGMRLTAGFCVLAVFGGCADSPQDEASGGGPPRSAISGPLPDKGDLLFLMRGESSVTEDKRRPRAAARSPTTVAKRDPEADARLRGVHDRIEV